MKPKNISDILENLKDAFFIKNGELKPESYVDLEILIRSQIEQLLGRIDTEKLSEYARKKEVKERKLDNNQAHDLMAVYYGKNKKSSEISNQILELKK